MKYFLKSPNKIKTPGPLAKLLSDLREKKKLKTNEVKGVSQSLIQKIENENHIPKKITLIKLAEELNDGDPHLLDKIEEAASKQEQLLGSPVKYSQPSPVTTSDSFPSQPAAKQMTASKSESTGTSDASQEDKEIKVVKSDSQKAVDLHHFAILCFKDKNLPAALAACEKASILDPKKPTIFHYLAILKDANRDQAGAVAAKKTALELEQNQ